MNNYIRLPQNERDRVDAINAYRLKRKYTPQEIRRMSNARQLAYGQREFPDARVKALRSQDLPIDISGYQLDLANRIVNGEYGGFPREVQVQRPAPVETVENRVQHQGQPAQLNLGF